MQDNELPGVRLNLFNLKQDLQKVLGREIDLTEMAKGMGINYWTLYNAFNGKSAGIQFDTIGKMLGYFRREGLDVSMEDLLVEESRGKIEPVYGVGALA